MMFLFHLVLWEVVVVVLEVVWLVGVHAIWTGLATGITNINI